jgi:hypothetical protein
VEINKYDDDDDEEEEEECFYVCGATIYMTISS